MFSDLREDASFLYSLRYPGQPQTWFTRARLLLTSRGWLLLAGHRAAQAMHRWDPGGPVGKILRRGGHLTSLVLWYLLHVFTKSEIRLDSALEAGVFLSDGGHIVLGARLVGTGTVIHDRVTIGWSLLQDGTPEIGRHVWIGPNAVIAGNIKVGDGVTILPNTVLTRSLPAGVMVQGNPAQVVQRNFDNAALRRTLATEVGSLLPEKCPS